MSTLPPSPSLDDLIVFVGEEVASQYQRNRQRVNGASLAEAIRKRFPDLSYPALGVERLADVVRAAEERGLLFRHWDVKHLEVSPAGVDAAAPSSSSLKPRAGRIGGPVPREIWQAVLFPHQGQARFIDRQTGNVIIVSETEAGSYTSNPRYVELRTIPPEVQKNWMREFVAENSEAAVATGAIESDPWYSAFWQQLRTVRSELATAWGATRARHVIEYLKSWAKENEVPIGYLLTPQALPAGAPRARATTKVLDPSTQHGREDEALRVAVMGALGDMSLDELLSLSLPLRHLVRHFRPR